MIRLITLDDLDEVLAIEKDLFNDHWSKDNFIYEIKDNPYSDIYGLIIDETIIGYIAISILYERLEVNNLAVKKAFQQQGYGQKLLDFAINKAKEEGCEVISLEVKVTNLKALKLYEKNGFIKMRTRYHYYSDGSDALEMARGL